MITKYKNIIGGVLGFLLLAFAVWYFFKIVLYILIAIVLSLIAQPIVTFSDKLHVGKYKIPHILSVLAGMLSLIIGFSTLLYFILPLVSEQLNSLSSISISTIEEGLGDYIIQIEYFLKSYGLIADNTDLKSVLLNEVSIFFSKIQVSSFVSNIFDFAVSLFIGIFAVIFITFFILRDNRIVYRALFLIIPISFHLEAQRILKSTKNLLSRYYLGLIIDIILVGGIEATILWILGVENAFLIGFIGGLLNIIPYVGPILGMLIGLLLAVTSSLPMNMNTEFMPILFKVAGTFLCTNFIDAFLIQPFIYSKSVKAHPLEIFLIIVIGGSIAGVIGMMIAIPTYTFVRIVAREFFISNRIVQRLTDSLKEDDEK